MIVLMGNDVRGEGARCNSRSIITSPRLKISRRRGGVLGAQRAAAISEEKSRRGGANRSSCLLQAPTRRRCACSPTRSFAARLEHRQEADPHIMKHAKNWDLHRIAAVDRNVLRLAIFEMLHREDIPPVVSINEAVDIAKKFSTQDSGKFVNGILDKVKGELLRPARDVK